MSISQNFFFKFDSIVWRIIPDKSSDYILIELRDDQRKTVEFQGVDLLTGRLLPTLNLDDTSWWVGVEELNDCQALLHGYESEENPIHNGLYCYNLLSGNLEWQQEDVTFIQSNKSLIQIQDGDNQLILDKSGNTSVAKFIPEMIQEVIQSPISYLEDTDHFNTVRDFIEEKFDHKPVELIEYLEYRDNIFISYYIYNNQKLANLFKVFDANGKVLAKETLGSGLKGVGLNTFLISSNQLIFIKNKVELVGHLID